MKKNIMLGFVVAGFALNPLITHAGSDKYPAADFQPSVIYLDPEVAAQQTQAKDEFDPKYPAASFEPKVVYLDEALAEQAQGKDEIDAKYPAAYFKPKVIYP
ncbi:MAG: hypothetical protein PHR16_15070 [Methylovulum sp.]|nr:hypothetical protein [Methylovulum sp.]